MNRHILAAALVSAILSSPALALAQSGGQDGPITAATYDVIAIRAKYVDSVALAGLLDTLLGNDKGVVLKFLLKALSFINDRAQIPSAALLKRIASAASTGKPAKQFVVTASSGAVAPTSSFEGTLIYGVADFVVARAKEELTVVAFRRAHVWFKEDSALQALFPNTRRVVDAADDATTAATLQVVRTAVRKDLTALPLTVRTEAMRQCKTSTPVARCTPTAQAAVDALSMAGFVLERTNRGDSPVSALAGLAGAEPSMFLTRGGLRAARVGGSVASEAVYDGGTRLIALTQQDDLARQCLVVFIARAVFEDSVSVDAARVSDALPAVVNFAKELRVIFNELRAVKTAQLQGGQAETATQHRDRSAALIGAIANAMQSAVSISVDIQAKSIEKDLKDLSAIIATVADLARAVAIQDYTSVVFEGIAVARASGILTSQRLVQWATFGAALGSATTPAEVSAAVNQFALPQGSYLTKRALETGRTTQWKLYVNAYFGLAGGIERLANTPAGREGTAFFSGASLPIGLELAYAEKSYAISLFISVVDLGAVASYRFADSSTNPSPNVGFAQVMAPGLFATYAPWKDYPIALVLGYQYAPKLRNLKSGETVDAQRVLLLFAVDVPLLRLN